MPDLNNSVDSRIKMLLEKAKISSNLDSGIMNRLKGKRILVSGAAGTIGRGIVEQLVHCNYEKLILVDNAETPLYGLQSFISKYNIPKTKIIIGDIRNATLLRKLFIIEKPEIIYHAAAYKHVPMMESFPCEAVSNNVLGTRVIADLAVDFQVDKFIFISTDKAVNPTNVMGATKRIAEKYIHCLQKTSKTNFITTRFGNVLGSSGSVIPLFEEQIKNGGPLTLTHNEIKRYFMTTNEACQLVLEAGTMGKGGEIFVFDMGEPINIFDLAVSLIRFKGLRYPEDINIQVIGLRPGEKICEELMTNDEETSRTYNKKILIAEDNKGISRNLKKEIEDLCVLNLELDARKTVRKMKKIVPEFVSNNSEYQELDGLQ